MPVIIASVKINGFSVDFVNELNRQAIKRLILFNTVPYILIALNFCSAILTDYTFLCKDELCAIYHIVKTQS